MEGRDGPFVTHYLQCYLCDQACLQPRMCPKCTKSFCNHCLITSFGASRSDCPSCKARLRLEDFLSPQVVLGIVEQVAEGVRREVRKNEDR